MYTAHLYYVALNYTLVYFDMECCLSGFDTIQGSVSGTFGEAVT